MEITSGDCSLEELALRFRLGRKPSRQILELGIREWSARNESRFAGLAGVLETLATLPTPEEILALRPAEALQERIEELLEKNRSGSFTTDEQREWDQYQYVEHLVRLAKARAALKLNSAIRAMLVGPHPCRAPGRVSSRPAPRPGMLRVLPRP